MAILVYDFTGSPPTFGMPSGGSLIFGLAVALFAVIGVKLLQVSPSPLTFDTIGG